MDCRKWLLLAASLTLGGAGCITEQQNGISDKTTTTLWTPLSLFQKETKRAPKVETCLKGGESLEGQAAAAKSNNPEREQMLQQALKAYHQALESDPNNAQALMGVGRVYTNLNQYDKALAAYKAATKFHPKEGQVWGGLGMCQYQQKHYDQAVDAFRKAVELDPDERAYSKHLSLSLALCGREQESVQVLGKLYGEAQAHYKYAMIMQHLDQPEKARLHLELALQRDPMSQPAHQLLNEINHQTNQINQASFAATGPIQQAAFAAPGPMNQGGIVPAAQNNQAAFVAPSPVAGLGFKED